MIITQDFEKDNFFFQSVTGAACKKKSEYLQ